MVFKRWQKSPSKKPPEKTWTNEEMKIIGWCLNKNIKIINLLKIFGRFSKVNIK